MKTTKPRLVIVGSGMGTVRLLEELFKENSPELEENSPEFDVTVLGAEPVPGYNRIMLSPLLAGEAAAGDILLRDMSWYQAQGINLKCGAAYRVRNIERASSVVSTVGGECFPYDRLILATGSNPVVPPVTGCDLKGVAVFRTLSDVETMLSAGAGASVVVAGGGLLGLEAAAALKRQGMNVKLIHSQSVLMNRQLDDVASGLVEAEMVKRGVDIIKPARIQTLQGSNGSVSHVVLNNGQCLDAQLVVFATGVRPDIQLMMEAGLECDQGVCINSNLETSDPNIFAFGECAQFDTETVGLVEPVYQQARILAERIRGNDVSYRPEPVATRLKVTGIQLFSSGDFIGQPDDEILTLKALPLGVYRRLVLSNNRLKGALLCGDTADGSWYQKLLLSKESVAPFRQQLMFGPDLSAIDNNKTQDIAA